MIFGRKINFSVFFSSKEVGHIISQSAILKINSDFIDVLILLKKSIFFNTDFVTEHP